MQVVTLRLASSDENFAARFAEVERGCLTVLERSYPTYYGDDYQLRRIVEDRCTLYLAMHGDLVVGVSYVKENLRRGGTAVYPDQYRRRGIAESLTRASLQDFPQQYTILSIRNEKMIALMRKVGFRFARSVQEIKMIVKSEFEILGDFSVSDDKVIFRRQSLKRGVERDDLTLLHTFAI